MKTKWIRSNQELSCMGESEGFTRTTNGELLLTSEEGLFCSTVYDSGVQGMAWDELHLTIKNNPACHVAVWIFDSIAYAHRLKQFSFNDRFYAVLHKGQTFDHQDVLLYHPSLPTGQYLIFTLSVSPIYRQELRFSAFTITFPARKFAAMYLPEVYHDAFAIEAYMSVFKDMLLQQVDNIKAFPKEMALATCQEEHIEELLSWIGLERYIAYTTKVRCRYLPQVLCYKDRYPLSLWYMQCLLSYLFTITPIFLLQGYEVTIMLSNCEASQAKLIQAFCRQEFPWYLRVQLIFLSEYRLDETAYCSSVFLDLSQQLILDVSVL